MDLNCVFSLLFTNKTFSSGEKISRFYKRQQKKHLNKPEVAHFGEL